MPHCLSYDRIICVSDLAFCVKLSNKQKKVFIILIKVCSLIDVYICAGVQCKNVGCLWLPSNPATCCINITFDWCVVWSQVCEYYNGFRVWLIQSRLYLFNHMFNPGIYKMLVLSMIKWLSFVIPVNAEDITERLNRKGERVCVDSLLFWRGGWWLWPTDAGCGQNMGMTHRSRVSG